MTAMCRTARIGFLLAFTLGALTLAGCGTVRMVPVRSGRVLMCKYGEVALSDVQTVTVAADRVGRYRVVETTITCSLHTQLEKWYWEAQQAIDKGDLRTAKTVLSNIETSDRTFMKAESQLADIRAGRKPTADKNAPQPAAVPASTSAVGRALSRYIPATLPGYVANAPDLVGVTAIRTYHPSPARAGVGQLVVRAVDLGDAAQAASYVSSTVRSTHSVSWGPVEVSGRTAYFGTDGTSFAALGWNDGTVALALEMYSSAGRPADLKPDLIAVAKILMR